MSGPGALLPLGAPSCTRLAPAGVAKRAKNPTACRVQLGAARLGAPRGRRTLALLLLFAACASAVEVIPLFTSASAGDLLRWEIRGLPANSVGNEVARNPVLVIMGPDRRQWRRHCFAAQEFTPGKNVTVQELDPVAPPTVEVRHTPREAGLQRWNLLSPEGKVLAAGQVLVGPGTVRGPVRISTDNPRLLAKPDGSVLLTIGPNLCWAEGPDRVAAFARWLPALRAAGCNHVRLWLSSWCGQIESDTPDQYRLDQAWLVDHILDLARANDLYVTMVLDNHYDLEHGKAFPYGSSFLARQTSFLSVPPPAQYERRLRHVLARWGADDTVLAWELMNELDLAQPIRELSLPWAESALALLTRLDADRRLRTVSWAGVDWERLAKLPGLDLVQLHTYVLEWVPSAGPRRELTRDGVGLLVEPGERAAALGLPFCFGETGYQGTNAHNPGNDLDTDGLLFTQQLWAGLLTGGHGTAMNWWWDGYLEPNGLFARYRAVADITAAINWRDAGLTPLAVPRGHPVRILGWRSPTQALLWPHLRADTWHRALVDRSPRPVLAAATAMPIGGFLSGGTATLTRYDWRTGQTLSSATAAITTDGTLHLPVGPTVGEVLVVVQVNRAP